MCTATCYADVNELFLTIHWPHCSVNWILYILFIKAKHIIVTNKNLFIYVKSWNMNYELWKNLFSFYKEPCFEYWPESMEHFMHWFIKTQVISHCLIINWQWILPSQLHILSIIYIIWLTIFYMIPGWFQ